LDGTLTAQVAVPLRLDKTLTYSVPSRLEASIEVGVRVVVEVKRKVLSGFVVGLARQREVARGLKPVREIADRAPILTPEILKLGRWIADYYVAPLGEVLAAMSPPPIRLKRVYRLARPPGDLEMEVLRATSPARAEVIRLLEAGPAPRATLRRKIAPAHASALGACLAGLEADGVVAVEVVASTRRERRPGGLDTGASEATSAEPPPVPRRLTAEQAAALEGIGAVIKAGGFKVFLLYGVTGSGKTEVYLRAIERAVRLGKTAIYLVPEIALTPQIMERVEARFGGRCAVLHSRLSDGERYAAWLKMQSGAIDVVVGARSAVFAPLRNLGIIVVDEEHEASYKQQDSPRYNAREVAIVRAKQAGAVAVLGSATPAIETYHNALTGRYGLFELPKRISGGRLPEVTIVDAKGTSGLPLGEAARAEIARSLAASEQVVLFLNRRGFSNYIQCRDCGLVPRCRNCQVTLTYHLHDRHLACHYCGYGEPGWESCPKCGGANVEYVGSGTQKVEERIAQDFPGAACARLDKDTTRRKGSTEAVLGDFASGMTRMLVGTQMVAKGHDFRGVGLVVVVNADVTMNLPDFRSGERTFGIVTQVAGRAGRGDVPGRVVIQTFNPEHHALVFAAGHDFKGFYDHEIGQRKDLGYPPFARLARVMFESRREGLAKKAAHEFGAIAKRLGTVGGAAGRGATGAAGGAPGRAVGGVLEVMGPSRAPIARIKNVYRWHLLIKGARGGRLSDLLRSCIGEMAERGLDEGVRVAVDVDPQVML
jgi:primosomal protein N' (replication factor Y)